MGWNLRAVCLPCIVPPVLEDSLHSLLPGPDCCVTSSLNTYYSPNEVAADAAQSCLTY